MKMIIAIVVFLCVFLNNPAYAVNNEKIVGCVKKDMIINVIALYLNDKEKDAFELFNIYYTTGICMDLQKRDVKFVGINDVFRVKSLRGFMVIYSVRNSDNVVYYAYEIIR